MLASWVNFTATCQPCCCRATMFTDLTSANKRGGREAIRCPPQTVSLAAVMVIASAGLMLPSVWKMDERPFR